MKNKTRKSFLSLIVMMYALFTVLPVQTVRAEEIQLENTETSETIEETGETVSDSGEETENNGEISITEEPSGEEVSSEEDSAEDIISAEEEEEPLTDIEESETEDETVLEEEVSVSDDEINSESGADYLDEADSEDDSTDQPEEDHEILEPENVDEQEMDDELDVYAASRTTPEKVSTKEALDRIIKLKNALEGTYFTTTGSTCHSPWESGHGCSDDNVTNVVAKNASIKNKLGMVPDFSVVKLKHYNSNGNLNGQNGYSCYGFASFAAWYVYAQRPTDQVDFNLLYTGKDTKEQILKCRPGDIIRSSAGHSTVFIENCDNGSQYRVIDCNWNSDSSQGNCKIRVRNVSYGKLTVAISRASNSIEINNYKTYFWLNYSGRNYALDTDFSSLNPEYYFSRDTSVATISIDTSNTHNGYNSLKIVNKTAGSDGKDLAFATNTQGKSGNPEGFVGDNKSMTYSFWAKSSNAGSKIYFRYGYEGSYRSVTLNTYWTKYTVSMNKTASSCNNYVHPYVDSAGTVWISELQLEDGTSASEFVPETGGLYDTKSLAEGSYYTLPSNPSRTGYTFNGWYTAAAGGSQITSSTTVKNANNMVYAHWTPNTYTVYFDANGGSCSTSSKYVTYDSTYGVLPTPTKSGSTFRGWYTSAVGGTRIYNTDKVRITSSQTLYAQWAQVPVHLTRISLDKSELGLTPTKTEKLTVTYYPSNTTDSKTVTWSSSKTSVATISNGTVKAVKAGTAVITARTAGGLTASCKIVVQFTDITDPSLFYYTYVYDMVDRDIVGGYNDGSFRPNADCNRAAVVTFLWRLMGRPEPKGMADFIDMTGNEEFDKAISWAAENKITVGWSDNTFRPWETCNRAAVMTFLWRVAGKPQPTKMASFKDMTGNEDFDKAISWAAEKGITTGWDDNTFRPWNKCNRLAIVSFLARYNALN